MIYYKCTRPDGTDFRTGRFSYVPTGAPLVEPAAMKLPTIGKVDDSCGVGLHLSPTAFKAAGFGNHSMRPWRYFECDVDEADIIASDHNGRKIRARKVTPLREVPLLEVLGHDMHARVERAKLEIDSWKTIPWLKPAAPVLQSDVERLLGQWHDALRPWAEARAILGHIPRVARIVTDRKLAAAAAAADAAAAAAAADAAAAAAAAAADAAAADAADAADADAAAAAGGFYSIWPYWARWYVRPRWTLWRSARWSMFMGDDQPNPYTPLVELYKIGCVPIGYCRLPGVSDEVAFTVYVPEVAT